MSTAPVSLSTNVGGNKLQIRRNGHGDKEAKRSNIFVLLRNRFLYRFLGSIRYLLGGCNRPET